MLWGKKERRLEVDGCYLWERCLVSGFKRTILKRIHGSDGSGRCRSTLVGPSLECLFVGSFQTPLLFPPPPPGQWRGRVFGSPRGPLSGVGSRTARSGIFLITLRRYTCPPVLVLSLGHREPSARGTPVLNLSGRLEFQFLLLA